MRFRLTQRGAIALAFILALSFSLVTAYALDYNGSSSAGNSGGTTSDGYAIPDINGASLIGFRFSLVAEDGSSLAIKGAKSVDIYTTTQHGNEIMGYMKFENKQSKAYYVSRYTSANIDTTPSSTNCYWNDEVGFDTLLPSISGAGDITNLSTNLDAWQKNSKNIEALLNLIGHSSIKKLDHITTEKIIIEPIFMVRLEGQVWHALTLTELAVTAGGYIYDDDWDGGTASYENSNSGTYGFIIGYTNYHFANYMYTEEADCGWGAASKLSTLASFRTLITKGYGANVLSKPTMTSSYTVTYDATGGTGAPANQTKYSGTNLTLSSTKPTRPGYKFAGWNTKADGSGTSYAAGGTYSINASVTLYAQWTANKLTIGYYSNYATSAFAGALNSVSSSSNVLVLKETYNYDDVISGGLADYSASTDPAYLARKYYTATGKWGSSASGGTLVDEDTAFATAQALAEAFGKDLSEGDVTIRVYAQWTANKLTIGYYSNYATESFAGALNSVSSSVNVLVYKETFTYGDSLPNGLANYSLSTDSVYLGRLGHTATGKWATNASGSGYAVDEDTAFATISDLAIALGVDLSTGDKTVRVYAQWTPNTYTIEYNGNGYTGGSTADSIHTYGVAQNLTKNGYTRTGYTFAGWNTQANGSGTSYTDEQEVINLTSEAGATITLYAQWTANTGTKYVVKHWQQNLDGNATSHDSSNYTCVETENKTGTTGAKVTPAVKSYTGFTAPATQTVTIAADGSTVVNYYYTRNSYTVTLNKGTGISAVSGAGTYLYGESVTINATVSSGYTWDSWTGTHNVATQKYTFDMPASNVTDTANAEANLYTITLNKQSGSGGTTTLYELYGVKYYINTSTKASVSKISVPSRTGYTFGGYYTSTNGNGTQIIDADGNILKGNTYFEEDDTLYAYWTANTNTKYVVKHWQQNLDGNASSHDESNYTLIATENKTGTTGAKVTPAVKSYTGFTAPAKQTVTIAADGSTVVNYYYTRNSYTVTLNKGTGISAVSGAGTYLYGESVTINATVSSGYTWDSWTGTHNTTTKEYTFDMPASNVTDTANAIANAGNVAAYIDGKEGSDSNSGTTPSDPVLTFKQAYTNLKDTGGIIYVVDTVQITSKMTLTSTSYEDAAGNRIELANGKFITIKRYAKPTTVNTGFNVDSNLDHMIMVNTGGNLTLRNITVDGHRLAVTTGTDNMIAEGVIAEKPMFYVIRGTLNIENGAILRNNYNDFYNEPSNTSAMGGAVLVTGSSSTKGTVNMTGGTIIENYAGYGGGVYIDSDGVFNFIGGDITRNVAFEFADGGGIAVSYEGTLNMTGGNVTYNVVQGSDEAHIYGGGISNLGTFTMSGGSISNNTSNFRAGGVSNSGTFTMEGGSIDHNTASDWGGGMYNIGTFNFSGGSITDNTGSSGGGVYNAWSSKAIINMTGGTISDNTATGAGGGIYNYGTLNMSSGTITNNTAVTGGGIYNFEIFNLTGGTIKSNNATSLGDGVYQNDTLNMSADAAIDLSNDVCLASDRYITVVGKLNSSGQVAIITPYRYKNGEVVVQVKYQTGGNDTLASAVYEKFALTPKSPYLLRPGDYVNDEAGISDTSVIISEPYNVVFDPNGGINAPENQIKYWNEDLTLTSDKPTREGYVFTSWNTKASGSGTSYASGGVYTDNADLTLYAQWEEADNSYTIEYNGNGNTGGAMTSSTHTIGVPQTLSPNGYTKTGYIFDGWNTKADGSGTDYADRASVTDLTTTPGETVTLYAQWKPITYTIVYNGNGHTSGATASSTHTYDELKNLNANGYVRDGYTFTGWNTAADGSGTSYADMAAVKNLTTTNNATITLYAQWAAAVLPEAPYEVGYTSIKVGDVFNPLEHLDEFEIEKQITDIDVIYNGVPRDNENVATTQGTGYTVVYIVTFEDGTTGEYRLVVTVYDYEFVGKIRFISLDHLNTLMPNSKWRIGTLADRLEKTLSITEPTDADAIQVWHFSADDIKAIREWVEEQKSQGKGREEQNAAFDSQFGDCRVK